MAVGKGWSVRGIRSMQVLALFPGCIVEGEMAFCQFEL